MELRYPMMSTEKERKMKEKLDLCGLNLEKEDGCLEGEGVGVGEYYETWEDDEEYVMFQERERERVINPPTSRWGGGGGGVVLLGGKR